MTRTILLCLLGLLSSKLNLAQEISNLRAESQGDSVRISYDLKDAFAARTYTVNVKGIIAEDTVALSALSGSLGDSIRAGSHEVWWNSVSDLGRYKGSVSFYIEALPDFYISAPDTGLVVKRGKPITFKWYGGNAQYDSLKLDLYQYDKFLYSIDVVKNGLQYTWKVPSNLAADAGYRFKITGSDQTDIEAYSAEFAVKRQYPPYLVYLPPILAAGGLIYGFAIRWGLLPRPEVLPGN
ncbi:MAG: Ser-Thr-rich GPI-anchored membrane family protein [Bacteroidia bacterium]